MVEKAQQSESSSEEEPGPTSASYAKLVERPFDPSRDFGGSSSADDHSCESETDSSDESSDSDGESCGAEILTGFRLIDLEKLQHLTSQGACCRRCGGELSLSEIDRKGIASELVLSCAGCGMATSEIMSSKCGRFYEVNRRAVLAARLVGLGREGLCTFFGMLNAPPPMAKRSYDHHVAGLLAAATTVAERSMSQAAQDVRVLQEEEGKDNPSDLAVTADGTWMKRGHTSLHGVTTVIAWPTGQMIDYEVMSRFCKRCSHKRALVAAGKLTELEFNTWLQGHDDCDTSTTGSAGSMEVQGALAEWRRSETKHGLRYTTFIGDGDCKSHDAVQAAQPYGDGVDVVKEECVGHVQKRVGKRLRELKKRLGSKKLSDGKTIGGQGRLPDRVIDMLQTYFGMAIRSNSGDLQAMAQACWAAVMHKVAFPPQKRHQYCPQGGDSWCQYQQHRAGAAEEYVPKDSIPLAVFDAIKPIWQSLTDKSLLRKCQRGATQNRNESWNGMLWSACPKTKFFGKSVVELSAALMCIKFNHGSVMYSQVLREMGIPPGAYTTAAHDAADDQRVAKGERKATDAAKQARKRRRRVRKGIEDDIGHMEGEVYGAGIAD